MQFGYDFFSPQTCTETLEGCTTKTYKSHENMGSLLSIADGNSSTCKDKKFITVCIRQLFQDDVAYTVPAGTDTAATF
jgi:hypothetical protein